MRSLKLMDDSSCELALWGGSKAFAGRTGVSQPKVGVEEFLSIAERFGFSPEAMERLAGVVSDADLGSGPHLGRYYGSAHPSMGDRFEQTARALFGVKHAVPTCNGTCALQSALMAVGAGPGTEVICPAIGFLATSLAGAMLGATPVFCDVDASLQMDPEKLEALITPRTIAILPTHYLGHVCDMDPILEIARRRGVRVIEDCAQSPGATYRGRRVGTMGDIGCFSISCYKIIGGGEGGMVVTNDDRLINRLRQAAEAGGLWRRDRFAPPQYPGELFVGSNFRLSELESAINIIQLKKLDGIISRYRNAWERIRTQLGTFDRIEWQPSNDPQGDIPYQVRLYPTDDALGRPIAEALRAEGVDAGYRGGDAGPDWHVSRYYFPLFERFAGNCSPKACPVASDLFDRCLWIHIDQWWNEADCDAVAHAVNKVLGALAPRLDRPLRSQKLCR